MRQHYSRIALAGLAICTGCRETVQPSGDARGASSIGVSPGTVRLVPGDSVRLTAVARDASGAEVAGASFVWTSRKTAVANVSATGVVRAEPLPATVPEDTAWIVGSAATLRDSARIVVASRATVAGAARMGINLDMVNDWSTEWPFTDLFRSSRNWISQREGAAWGTGGPLALTSDNWVASLESGQYATTIMLGDATGHQPGGEYVLLYDGDGDVQFETASGVTVVSQSPGRIVARVPAGGVVLVNLRRTNASNLMRNIRFVPTSLESSYSSRLFTDDFLRVVRPFGVLRFMNWQFTNRNPPGEWARRATTSFATYATERGVPVETMVALANETGADPWFCMPHDATDDYVRQFATLVRAQLGPRQRVYVEYSNEVWNSLFPQATYAIDRGQALGLSSDRGQAALRFQSQRSVEMFAIWRSVFGADSARVVRVLASHVANGWTAEQVLGWRDAFRSADVLAIAPYFGGRFGGRDGAAESTMTEAQLLDGLAAELEDLTRGFIEANARIAQAYGVKLVAYEGGQHLVSAFVTPAYEPAVTRLFTGVNRHARMADLYRRYFEIWYGAGGDLFVPFVAVSPWGKFGSWGALEYVHQDPATSPKYRAILEGASNHD